MRALSAPWFHCEGYQTRCTHLKFLLYTELSSSSLISFVVLLLMFGWLDLRALRCEGIVRELETIWVNGKLRLACPSLLFPG